MPTFYVHKNFYIQKDFAWWGCITNEIITKSIWFYGCNFALCNIVFGGWINLESLWLRLELDYGVLSFDPKESNVMGMFGEFGIQDCNAD